MPDPRRYESVGSTYFCLSGRHGRRFHRGILHTALGIPGILASILADFPVFHQLKHHGAVSTRPSVLTSTLWWSRSATCPTPTAPVYRFFATCILFCFAIVAILYWYFGTEQGHAIRATGCNQQMARAQDQHQPSHRHCAHDLQRSGRSPAVCTPSIRVRQMSTWGAAPSSSVLLLSLWRSYFRQTLRREESRFRLHAVFP